MQNNALSREYKQFLALLNKHEVEYLLVGGYAVGIHGYLRYTGDIDIWIDHSIQNAEKIVKAVVEFGVPVEDVSTDMFTTEDKNVFIGESPLRVDIMKKLSRVSFKEAYNNKREAEIDGVIIHCIGLDDLITTKKASARPKDLEDLKHLIKPKDKF